MMNREKATQLYKELRSAGYSHDEAANELKLAIRGERSEDPTAQYWEALINQESGGRQSAVSPKGAVGVAQVMPATGPEAAKLAGREWDERAYREDPEYNGAIGRAYLRAQMRRFGDPRLGLAAYNAGPGRVQQHLEQGVPLPPETRNYVPAITGRSEQSMTRDQARQYAQQRLAEGADMATIKQEIAARMGKAPAVAQQPAAAPVAAPQPAPQPAPAPAMAAQAPQPAPQTPAAQPEQLPSNLMFGGQDIDQTYQDWIANEAERLKDNPYGKFKVGVNQGVAGMLRGARQLWNEVGSDAEDAKMAEYLRGQEAKADKFEESINPSGSGINSQDIGKVLPAMLGYGALKGPGVVAGAATGALEPVSPGESRLANAAIGGAIGGVGDVVVGGTKLAKFLRDRYKNTVDAREALDNFTTVALGDGRGRNSIPAYESVAKKVTGKLRELEDDFAKQYASVEANPNLPKVPLLLAGKAGDEFSMTEQVANVLTPRTQKLLNTISSSGERVSDIVDEAGKPIRQRNYATFEDIRTAIREIRSTARKLNRDDVSRLQLKKAERMLTDDLQAWANHNEGIAEKTLRAAQELDTKYRQQVVPFYSKKTPLGRYLGSETLDEKALLSNLLTEDSGMAIKDAVKRVPELTPDLRRLYGSKLREARGDILTIRKLESGTSKEALLSKSERDYLLKVADEIYKEGGPAQNSSVMPTGLMRLLEKTTFSQDLQRMIGGLRPYGKQAPKEFVGEPTKQLIKYLRTIGVDAATEE